MRLELQSNLDCNFSSTFLHNYFEVDVMEGNKEHMCVGETQTDREEKQGHILK